MALLRRLRHSFPLRLFLAFLLVYGVTAGVSLRRHSLAPHFIYLAESFLLARLDLLHVPAPPYDLTPFDGRWYVSFPPLPALLMLPLVAVRGLAVSDIAFSVFVGALDGVLFAGAAQRAGIEEQDWRCWLCAWLALGTPLWYCATFGTVWYTAHVVAVACLCLYAAEALGRNRPFLAGLWLGLGSLARAPMLLAFPLSLWGGLLRNPGRREKGRFLLLFALGLAPALLGQAAYNYARFGDVAEFGYRWMNSPGPLAERQATWGQFSLHFLPENLYTLLIRPPLVSLDPLRIAPDPWGMGLLLTCPALLLSVFTLTRRPLRHPIPALWLSILLVQTPSLLYFNTGSYQFGYRFALDWLPLGLLLAGLGARACPMRWRRRLIVVSVLMHLWGVLWMYPNFNGQAWHIQYADLLRRLGAAVGLYR